MSSNVDTGQTPKAIGSLAKKQSDVTRQGTQKLKFVPTLPQRRKKEDVKKETASEAVPSPSSDRGRGRGHGARDSSNDDGRGRGRGRGGSTPSVVEMTASGPFAMGPTLAGGNARRSTPRSNFVAGIPLPSNSTSGSHFSMTTSSSLKTEVKSSAKGASEKEHDYDAYSDPDDGVEIVDIQNVRRLDWMAPDTLQNDRQARKLKKHTADAGTNEVDLANALNLSESEEEEELEDIIEDFTSGSSTNAVLTSREELLYLFQFPKPFPSVVPKETHTSSSSKKVSFAPDLKSPLNPELLSPTVGPHTQEGIIVDGIIGKLEIYRSGAVKIRFSNGILLDVNAATQQSFLQQVVHLDKKEKRLSVLGEINKQFIVSPDINTLIIAMEEDRTLPVFEGDEYLITMDTT